jgi:hypothetical protein
MTSPPPNLRYERKFVLGRMTLADALAVVRRHPAGFSEVFPPRTVNNLYLDTPSLQAFHDHVNGVSTRAKTRVRWYGRNGAHSPSALELKFKQGVVGGKTTCPLAANSCGEGLSTGFVASLAGDPGLPELLRARLNHLEPALCNRYRRSYFKSMDGHFRLTVDSDLEFRRPAPGVSFSDPFPFKLGTIVLELKFDPRHEDGAQRLGQHFPARLGRCSKYVLGIQTVSEMC